MEARKEVLGETSSVHGELRLVLVDDRREEKSLRVWLSAVAVDVFRRTDEGPNPFRRRTVEELEVGKELRILWGNKPTCCLS